MKINLYLCFDPPKFLCYVIAVNLSKQKMKKIKVNRTSLEKYSAGTIWLENFMYLCLSGKKYLEIMMLFYSVGINVELTYSYCSWRCFPT